MAQLSFCLDSHVDFISKTNIRKDYFSCSTPTKQNCAKKIISILSNICNRMAQLLLLPLSTLDPISR